MDTHQNDRAVGNPRSWLISLLLAVTLLFTAACENGTIRIEAPGNGGEPAAENGQTAEGDWHTVPLRVVEGPEGQVLAFVPVYINGEGPFAFALDTGASRTLVNQPLVEQLNLEVTGSAGPVSGVAAKTTAQQIDLNQWRIGDLELQQTSAVTLPLGGEEQAQQGAQIDGLLGSDVLSRFGVITVDFESQELRLKDRSRE